MLADKLKGATYPVASAQFNGFIGVNSTVNLIAYSVDSNADGYVIGGLESTSPQSGFVMSLDRAGNLNWQRKITSSGLVVGVYSIKLDSSGNVYAYVDIGTTLYLIKYSSSGVIQWQRKISNTNPSNLSFISGRWLQIGSDGSVYLLCDISSTPYSVGIIKYNSSGVLQWKKQYTAPVALAARYLAIDSSNNLYIGFGYGTLANSEYTVRKVDSSGNVVTGCAVQNIAWSSYAGAIIVIGSSVFITSGIGASIGAEIMQLDSSLNYQSSTKINVSPYTLGFTGSCGNNIIYVNSDFNKYATVATGTLDVTGVRSIDSSVGANEGLFCVARDSDLIVASGRAYMTSASRYDAIIMCLDPLADIGTYTPMSVANVSFSEVAGSNRISAQQELTFGNALSISDDVGTATDSAASYSVTLYEKV